MILNSKNAGVAVVLSIFLIAGCRSNKAQAPLSYKAAVGNAQEALGGGSVAEAKKWAGKAMEMKPESLEAQKLMAKAINRETASEKYLTGNPSPALTQPTEELDSREKEIQTKTWLERSRAFLEINQFEDALLAAERVFQFDPENSEASRLIDEIKEKARKQGKEDSLFLQSLYQEEVEKRIQRYTKQAESWLQDKKWGAARLAIEKILLLDPENEKGRRLLAMLGKKDETRKTF